MVQKSATSAPNVEEQIAATSRLVVPPSPVYAGCSQGGAHDPAVWQREKFKKCCGRSENDPC